MKNNEIRVETGQLHRKRYEKESRGVNSTKHMCVCMCVKYLLEGFLFKDRKKDWMWKANGKNILYFDTEICYRESSRSKQGGEWTNPDGMDSALTGARVDGVELELMTDTMLLVELRSAASKRYNIPKLILFESIKSK